MGTKDLTHKAIARALANGEPLTHDQRAALLSLVADDKVWQRKHDEMADQMRAYAAAAVAAEGERWKEPADERKQVEHADAENRALRRLLAVRVSGASLYTDDGELQDNSQRPFIDYYCDSPAEIHRKLQERAKRKHDEMADQMRAYAAAAVAAERERSNEIGRLAIRALCAWDESVLPKSNDGMMQERMEDLRAALAQQAEPANVELT